MAFELQLQRSRDSIVLKQEVNYIDYTSGYFFKLGRGGSNDRKTKKKDSAYQWFHGDVQVRESRLRHRT